MVGLVERKDIPEFLSRKHGKSKITFLHPRLESILKETYGIIVYQEQVMQIAQILSGYSLGEADIFKSFIKPGWIKLSKTII